MDKKARLYLDKVEKKFLAQIKAMTPEYEDLEIYQVAHLELKEAILKIADLLWPFIPDASEKIKKQFTAEKIKKGEILFKKIE